MNNITVTREESEISENKQTGFTKLTIQQIMNLLWVAAQVVLREERGKAEMRSYKRWIRGKGGVFNPSRY